MNAAAYIERAKLRHTFTCPCGARRRGRDLTWPRWSFKITVHRLCGDPSVKCSTPTARGIHTVRLGPYPPETPVCTYHTLEKVAS